MNDDQVSDSWERGSAYERYVGRWSRMVAPEFLLRLQMPAGLRWVDVGCGTGALAASILDRCSPSSVVGVEPSEGFLNTARANLAGRAELYQGTAKAIPLANASADVVVSGLMLNFVPDPQAALIEMARVTGGGGTIAAYVWDYAGRMQFMRYFWDAAVALDPAAADRDEGSRFPLCNPSALTELFASVGFIEPEVWAIDISTPFTDFDDYWQPFLEGQGPAPAYALSLGELARMRLRDLVRERLPLQSDGSIPLIARAWAIRAAVGQG